MYKMRNMSMFIYYLRLLEDCGLTIKDTSQDGKQWRREFTCQGNVVAWEEKVSPVMLRVPWKDRVHGDHLHWDIHLIFNILERRHEQHHKTILG